MELIMQPKDVMKLDIEPESAISDETRAYFDLCEEKLGLIPNVLTAYSFNETKLRTFTELYNDLMLGESALSKLQREMIAVVVSSINRCVYCMVAHGATLRQLSGDPALGELMVMNFRAAQLDDKDRAMLEFSSKLTTHPQEIVEKDRQALRDAGWADRDIWDIANIVGFFNMTNRVASATEMEPNSAYHNQSR